MKAYVITPNSERQEAAPRPRDGSLHPEAFSYEELQDIVGGYYRLITLTAEVVMVVNEEEEDLPYNDEATKVIKKALPKWQGFIAGNALVCLSDMVVED